MDLITSLTSQVTRKALDGLSMRHKAIASNLANADTPHYKRQDVSFEDSLSRAISEGKNKSGARQRPASNDEPLAMRATRAEHFPIGQSVTSVDDVQPAFVENVDMRFRNDGNSVDVETEMVQLAKNTERYLALTNLQSRMGRSLRSIISGGGS